AASRLIVQSGVKEALLSRIAAHLRDWPMGDPLDPEMRVGALVSPAHFAKVASYLKGASILQGGAAEAGFVEPTLIDVAATDAQAREEIFGPVLSVITVETADEAIAMANDTTYGLAASIFTSNVKRALRGARAIRAGTVTVNCFGEGDISTPFGGYKTSGFGGRDNGIQAHEQYTQLKTIWVDLSDDAEEAVA
ncbi:MAG: aldehyde dehydrogenase family protein, partial [Pseudomonadota bacterium]